MGRGRKSKCTPDVVALVVEAIGVGATYELAAWYAGIHPSTLYDWINTKPDFSEAVKKAEARDAIRSLAKITQEKAWPAHAWKLERRHGYVRPSIPTTAEAEGQETVATVANQYGIDPAELAAALGDGKHGH